MASSAAAPVADVGVVKLASISSASSQSSIVVSCQLFSADCIPSCSSEL